MSWTSIDGDIIHGFSYNFSGKYCLKECASILASDWNHNKAILSEGDTAVFYPAHDVDALTNVMKDCIDGKIDLGAMAINCQEYARDFDTNTVITSDILDF